MEWTNVYHVWVWQNIWTIYNPTTWGWSKCETHGADVHCGAFMSPWGRQKCLTHGVDMHTCYVVSPWGWRTNVHPMGVGTGVMCQPQGRWHSTCYVISMLHIRLLCATKNFLFTYLLTYDVIMIFSNPDCTVLYGRRKHWPYKAEYGEDQPGESSGLVADSCDDWTVTVGTRRLNWKLADDGGDHSRHTHHHGTLLTSHCVDIQTPS